MLRLTGAKDEKELLEREVVTGENLRESENLRERNSSAATRLRGAAISCPNNVADDDDSFKTKVNVNVTGSIPAAVAIVQKKKIKTILVTLHLKVRS